MLKEAKLVLEGAAASKPSRRRAGRGDRRRLEQAQTRKVQLEDRIEIGAQFRLVRATESASGLALGDSKLNQTENSSPSCKTG